MKDTLLAFHRKLLNPACKGPLLALCRCGLRIAAAGYGIAVRVRNRLYDHGLKRIRRAGVPVISVGNITAGGTGKTPFVAYLAEFLSGFPSAFRPVILSRGYGKDPVSGVDDENEMLRRLLPDVPIVVNPDRVAGAAQAINRYNAGVLILDDGFQHRRLARDLDIVLVDALNPFGAGYLLPRGLLREPLGALARADFIILTNYDLVPFRQAKEIKQRLKTYAPRAGVLFARHLATGVHRLPGTGDPAVKFTCKHLKDGHWAAFCGLGNPKGFLLTLCHLGARIGQFDAFPDHHKYTRRELADLLEKAKATGCRGLVTTEKDAVKIERLLEGQSDLPVLALGIEMGVVKRGERLGSRILDTATGKIRRRQ